MPLLGLLAGALGGGGGGAGSSGGGPQSTSINLTVTQTGGALHNTTSVKTGQGQTTHQGQTNQQATHQQAQAHSEAQADAHADAKSHAQAHVPYLPTATSSPEVSTPSMTYTNTDLEQVITELNGLIMSLQANQTPIGVVQAFAGVAVPHKYMECDGRELLIIDHRPLYNVIGTTYGVGSAPHSFRLPNLSARIIVGHDLSGSGFMTHPVNAAVLGSMGGSQSHILTVDEMPAHNHGGLTGDETTGGNNPRIYCDLPPSGGKTDHRINMTGPEGNRWLRVHDFDGPHAAHHAHNIPPQGSNASHNNVQPSLVLKYIIKVE